MPIIEIVTTPDLVADLLKAGNKIDATVVTKGLPHDAIMCSAHFNGQHLHLRFETALIEEDRIDTIEVTTIRTIGEPADVRT